LEECTEYYLAATESSSNSSNSTVKKGPSALRIKVSYCAILHDSKIGRSSLKSYVDFVHGSMSCIIAEMKASIKFSKVLMSKIIASHLLFIPMTSATGTRVANS